jgi:DNA helicase IV
VTGPDIEPRLVYDETNVEAPFATFIDRVVDHWRGLISDRIGLPPDPIDEATQTRIIDSRRGDFDLRPSIRARVRNINEDLLSLTKEQYRILDGLKENRRVVVRGAAGTGKTLLAIEEADRAVKEGRRVALLCSSTRLGDYLARAATDCTYVGHLHGLMRDVVRRTERTSQLPEVDKSDLLALFYPEQTLEGLADLEELGTIDVLIVDEAQDLLQGSYLDVFDGLLDGGLAHGTWRFFLDPVQNIFDVMHTPALQRVMAHEPTQFTLTVNCRNTQQIAVHTSLLSDVDLPTVLQVEGEKVDQEWFSDKRDLRRQVSRYVNRLLSGGLSPDDIAILGAFRLENSALSDGLIDSAYSVSDMPADNRKQIAYSSISGFKGLEADAVIVIEVDDLLSSRSRSALYVGTSRARALLSVFTHDGARDDYDELVRRLGTRLKGRPLT